MNSGVYSITNTATGEQYVGGSTNLPSRRNNHFSSLRHGRHEKPEMQASFREHGENAFRFVLLEACQPDQVLERERAWIQKLKPKWNHMMNVPLKCHLITFTVDAAVVVALEKMRERIGRPDLSISDMAREMYLLALTKEGLL